MITCSYCGTEYDPADLTQVIYHANLPHVPVAVIPHVSALRIDTLPRWVYDAVHDPTPTKVRRVVSVMSDMAEVLEHVAQGSACRDEAVRVLSKYREEEARNR